MPGLSRVSSGDEMLGEVAPTGPRARPRSVVARADRRDHVAFAVLFGAPLVAFVLADLSSGVASDTLGVLLAGVMVFTALTAWDVLVWVRVAAASRRMTLGLRPVRAGVDYGLGEDCWTCFVPADLPYRASDRRELVARGSPLVAEHALRRNLYRRLLALVAVAAMGGLVVVVLFCCWCSYDGCRRSSVTQVEAKLRTIGAAAVAWRREHPGSSCPSLSKLRSDHLIDTGVSDRDPWGKPYLVECDGGGIAAESAGLDGRMGTMDDIVVSADGVR